MWVSFQSRIRYCIRFNNNSVFPIGTHWRTCTKSRWHGKFCVNRVANRKPFDHDLNIRRWKSAKKQLMQSNDETTLHIWLDQFQQQFVSLLSSFWFLCIEWNWCLRRYLCGYTDEAAGGSIDWIYNATSNNLTFVFEFRDIRGGKSNIFSFRMGGDWDLCLLFVAFRFKWIHFASRPNHTEQSRSDRWYYRHGRRNEKIELLSMGSVSFDLNKWKYRDWK